MPVQSEQATTYRGAGIKSMTPHIPGEVSRIVIDLTRLKVMHCGLGQFCLHLGRALVSACSPSFIPELLVPSDRRQLLAEYDDRLILARPWMQEAFLQYTRPLLGRFLPKTPRSALWHATTQFVRYLPQDNRTPVLQTIHDLSFLQLKSPKKCERYLRRIQKLVDRAAAVTTISQFVADEVRKHVDLRGKPLYVVYNGLIAQDYADAARPDFMDERPFLFTIGDITPKKNFHVLVSLLQLLPQYRLVIAGNTGTKYAQEIGRLAAESGVSDRVIMPGIISDSTRCWMYKNCAAFLFPSISEGFGLPVIEAMRFGKPVFLSDSTSLPEIGGPLAFYWRAFSAEYMQEVFNKGMAAYAADETYPARLIAHARQFSWDRTAAQYVAVYSKVLENAQI
jgi:glycosyltransferase involved in cell wall biosynthesis